MGKKWRGRLTGGSGHCSSSVVVKRSLSLKTKLTAFLSIYAPSFTHGRELWVWSERIIL